MRKILSELDKAMTSNPDLSALEVIEFVMKSYKPYRSEIYLDDKPYVRDTYYLNYRRPTDTCIIKALETYNARK